MHKQHKIYMANASQRELYSHVGTYVGSVAVHARSVAVCVGSVTVRIGSMRLFGNQHVGIWLHWGPTRENMHSCRI